MTDTPDLDAIEAIAPHRLGEGLNESYGGKIRPIMVVSLHADDRDALCASIRAKDAEIARLRKALEDIVAGNEAVDIPNRPNGHIAGEFTFGDLRQANAALKEQSHD